MKKFITFIVGAVVIFSGWYLYKKNISLTTKQSIKKITVSQSITTNNHKFISQEVVGGETALDLLKSTTQLKTQGTGTNAYVTSINGREAKNSNKEYWALYINGKLADVGAGSYTLKNNDKIEWKIEKY